jgi:hypothetical protein
MSQVVKYLGITISLHLAGCEVSGLLSLHLAGCEVSQDYYPCISQVVKYLRIIIPSFRRL